MGSAGCSLAPPFQTVYPGLRLGKYHAVEMGIALDALPQRKIFPGVVTGQQNLTSLQACPQAIGFKVGDAVDYRGQRGGTTFRAAAGFGKVTLLITRQRRRTGKRDPGNL